MRLLPIKQAFAIGLVAFFPYGLLAEQELQSSFRIQMPQSLSHGKSKLLNSSYKINKNRKIKNFTLESEYPTWAENINLEVDLELSPLNPWNFSEPQNFETTKLNVKVNIGQTNTEYTETRASSGSSITIDLKAQCKNIILDLKSKASQLSGVITVQNLGNKIKLELNHAQVNWDQDSWKISSFQCEGTPGFERLAKKEIQEYLSSPDSLQDKVYDEIKKEILNLENEINANIFKVHELKESARNFLVNFEPHLLLPHKKNEDFRFDGVTRVRFKGLSLNKHKSQSVLFENTPPPSPHQGGPTFILPLNIVTPMMEQLFANGNFNETWWSDELEGFSDFMKSDSNRRYAWPEMLKYNSNSRFKFQAHIISKPTIRDIKNHGERIEMWVKSTLVIQMFAPQRGGYVPYVEWRAPFDIHASIQVYQGGLWYKILKDSKFNWSAKMVPQYVRTFQPKDAKIDAERIGEAVIEALIKKQYRIAIPNWKVSDQLEYRAEKMFRTETLLWIYWNEI